MIRSISLIFICLLLSSHCISKKSEKNARLKQETSKRIMAETLDQQKNNLKVLDKALDGLVVIDLDLIDYNNDSLEIFNDPGLSDICFKIVDKKFVRNNREFNYLDDRTDTLETYFSTQYFLPEYSIMLAKHVSKKDGVLSFIINDHKVYADSKSKYVSFISYSNFVLKNSVRVPDNVQIYSKPNFEGKLIECKGCVFKPIKIKGEWLLIKADQEIEGDLQLSGWVKWKENDKILVEVLLLF